MTSQETDETLNLKNLDEPRELPDTMLALVAFLLNRAAKNVVDQLEKDVEAYGLKAAHLAVLILLSQVDALSQKDIGERLQIDRNSMVRLVDELEKLGYAERSRDPNDRRYYAISMTEKARDILPEVNEIISNADNQFFSRLNQEELESLKSILRKLL